MHQPGPEVTLVRHGETAWSKSGRHTGRTDLDLTPAGARQAVSVRPLLTDDYDLVLVSPMLRARRTAELAGLVPFRVDDDLREWDYGSFEGLTTPEIQQDHPGWSIWEGPWAGGETADDVARRADRVVARVLRHRAGSRVAIVAHGHILRVVAVRWLMLDAVAGQYLALDTATVGELGWERRSPVVRRWNQPPPR